MSNGQIILTEEIKQNMEILDGDLVALIFDNGRTIMRKLTSGKGMMTFNEFILYRDVNIKNDNHRKIIECFIFIVDL